MMTNDTNHTNVRTSAQPPQNRVFSLEFPIVSSKTSETPALRKMLRVIDAIAECGSVLVAFSGGVDSSVLATLARESGARVLAVTADSELLGERGLVHATRMAGEIGVAHRVFRFDVLDQREFAENPPNRCYHCKKHLFSELAGVAAREGIGTVVDGTNLTDLTNRTDTASERPGYAALKEAGVVTPFVDFGLTKSEIREIASYLGLSVADEPSESCLATRIPEGTEITIRKLARIEKAESILSAYGLHGVRVRVHGLGLDRDRDQGCGRLACVEVQSRDVERFTRLYQDIAEAFGAIGFDRVVLSWIRTL